MCEFCAKINYFSYIQNSILEYIAKTQQQARGTTSAI